MFERFTERARQVVVLAQDEARYLNHSFIGTEHILIGLLREETGLAARVLESLGFDTESTRADVLKFVPRGEFEVQKGQIPFTPRAKKVLERALREALGLGYNYIGTEHVLLGLASEEEGIAARVLRDRGSGLDSIREGTLSMMGSRSASDPSEYERGWAAGYNEGLQRALARLRDLRENPGTRP